MVYLGIFAGFQINGFIANKKIVIADTTPLSSPATSPSSAGVPTPAPSANKIAQVLQTQTKSTNKAPAQQAPAEPAPPAQEAPAPAASTASSPPAGDTSPSAPQPSEQPPAPEPTQEPAPPAPDPRCIVTISGSQYDVTVYRNAHSGGNVFQCGTDMTAVFLSQHPASYLQKMAQYKI
ncbi:MAG: voltage gated chloride channel domain-containing protein [Candidatus Daviesbacteria bacterium GW2011_GWB1_39_5]|uniref:Voltage gated chloride channel domain-containing protein n=1 Tax=Candidatus Daviesbacteria bacterium GW2011_GWC2_40_12 TaxID=1618431 RepID=A0A0G0QMZ8_9BACT|nr:MAG: voltage gated chloride channel domain-containing protein [Candidatus Daviesbacteria bacterium GW2011_GWF2_38_7]KKR16529.1 MAG: voltage gated chloride channel domain-containing protein [Candidatus Daviesbacteria bacterium GW2011_GWA2_39_33]KKR24524.1 MAG: voltage gated chloride channel domain-containing protein [Candidatus Daviesbacteria bacterium GW2011_GWB1_39_5]KKR41794.1 MAG: voltage gated chloride channel domain-containing protein [Candidatus Daviesbacteria bacterium GW2011_GWC2_40_1